MRKKPESGNPNLERFALYKFIRRRKKKGLKNGQWWSANYQSNKECRFQKLSSEIGYFFLSSLHTLTIKKN